MELYLNRNYFRKGYTIGKLFIGDDYFCDTAERDYTGEHPCIPTGRYRVVTDIPSPRFRNRHPYKTLCKGCPPRLLSVPNRQGILIHIGNNPVIDSLGCILVGKNIKVGHVMKSMRTFTDLVHKLPNDEAIYINIYDLPLDNLSIEILEQTKCV